jgi:ribosomal protein S18 acetylase RimI-like enzyme
MKNNFIIQPAVEEEVSFISKRADEYKEKNFSLIKGQVAEKICRVIKHSDGSVMAGMVGFINHNFKSVYIDVLWVKEEFRKSGYGTIILRQTEQKACDKGINLSYLGTLGFQAKDFYIKNGYDVFATLDECAQNNKMFWMKKILNSKAVSFEIECTVEEGKGEDVKYIDSKLIEFNSQQLTFTNKLAFENMSKIIKDSEGNIIAGIVAWLLPWSDLSVDAIWTGDGPTKEELKIKLLASVEKELIEKGGRVAIHETFDTGRVDFLTRNGYEVYGILDDYPLG